MWDAAGLTAAAVDLVEALARAVSRPNRRALRSFPLRLLRDRFAATAPPGSRDRDREAVPRCLAALRFQSSKSVSAGGIGGGGVGASGVAVPAPGGDEDEGLALEFLAYLCVRLGGVALGDTAAATSAATATSASITSSSRGGGGTGGNGSMAASAGGGINPKP